MIHRPTFAAAEKISSRLLFTMIVSGSIYNNAEDFSDITPEGFDTLESIVFEHKEFELMVNGDHDCGLKACDMHIELSNAAAIVNISN
ncbi:hypothetical protein NOF04DRAFT_5041 [Fusarium oxysporum II5]|uniref:Uncharacterized protein n=2 Tax=Fusarium oxysporum species complex TaxID=171631 RepID=X0JE33_FUSO5|nr:uncharacterized protein FOIG_08493 [Fusarium odoratissimum NRRL 54006]EXL99447.1 hypothetical protein FOIG_08493 [Fusarium odoratissimum NRRL 54006]KAK2125244.1 hypothetical protein NOF04DRAFT_5041 [Fusarium oxysporum II5]TXC03041.1 hypothetical protein FocTR4_00015643 [Fusarium oxysporum f. sp. cubense]